MSIRTLKMKRKLKKSGLTSRQAESIVKIAVKAVSDSKLVTKEVLRAELVEAKVEVETEIRGVRTELLEKIGEVKTDMSKLARELEGKMETTKTDLIRWMIGSQAATLGVVFTVFGLAFALIRFFTKT